jgi:hypothetical protein
MFAPALLVRYAYYEEPVVLSPMEAMPVLMIVIYPPGDLIWGKKSACCTRSGPSVFTTKAQARMRSMLIVSKGHDLCSWHISSSIHGRTCVMDEDINDHSG